MSASDKSSARKAYDAIYTGLNPAGFAMFEKGFNAAGASDQPREAGEGHTPTPWTYLKFDEDQCLANGEESKLPPKETVFLGFDVFRWKVQIGIRESGGYMSLMLPEINDDCMIVAWAPLGETSEPDVATIRRLVPETWHSAINENYAKDGLTLIRGSHASDQAKIKALREALMEAQETHAKSLSLIPKHVRENCPEDWEREQALQDKMVAALKESQP